MTEPSVPAVPLMSKPEARALLDYCKTNAENLWGALLRARDEFAWKSLEYDSWEECLAVEFDMTKSYANRLIRHAEFAGELGPIGPGIPEGATRAIPDKARPRVAKKIVKATEGQPPDEAKQTAADILAAERAKVAKAKEAQKAKEPDPPREATPTPDEVPTGGLVVRDLRLPTALNHRAEERADDAGITVNEYVVALIEADLNPISTANGRVRQREKVGANAGAARVVTSPGAMHPLHPHKAEARGASGISRCKCGATRVGLQWREP